MRDTAIGNHFEKSRKIRGRFLDYDVSKLPDFDGRFPEVERLPQSFRIEINQRETGKCYLRWNGVFIGDPLTDNIEDSDDYRFHDVFHLRTQPYYIGHRRFVRS